MCISQRNEEDDRSVPENSIEPSNNRAMGRTFVPFKEQYESGFTGTCLKDDKEVTHVPSLSLMTPLMSEALDASTNTNIKSNNNCRGGSGSGLAGQLKLQNKPQQQSQQQQPFRKQRRCWSPELHRRFVESLQQLGGTQGWSLRLENNIIKLIDTAFLKNRMGKICRGKKLNLDWKLDLENLLGLWSFTPFQFRIFLKKLNLVGGILHFHLLDLLLVFRTFNSMTILENTSSLCFYAKLLEFSPFSNYLNQILLYFLFYALVPNLCVLFL